MKALRRISFSSIVLTSAVALASTAFAAGPKPAAADAEFKTTDTNKDGKVTAAEMDAAHQRVTGKKAGKSDMSAADKIKVVDTDGDGILTVEEHGAGSRAMFAKMDTDKDGSLTKTELAAGHASMMKKPAR